MTSLGNAGIALKYIIKNLPAGTYFWSVQAIDQTYAGGSFADEKSFTINGNLDFGLAAYYPFNGNANDESGNAHNGTVNGATLTVDRFGNAGKAYSFDGNDVITLDKTIANFGTSDFTISAWINGSAYPNTICQQPIFTNRVGAGSWLTFGTHNSALHAEIYAPSGVACATDPTLVANTWSNVMMIKKGDSIILFINNKFAKSSISSTIQNISNTTDVSQIGYYPCTGSGFTGVIDDIRIYNRALNTTEIKALYIEGVCPAPRPQAKDTSICGHGAVTITPSAGTTYYWYKTAVAGSKFITGNAFTTPVLTKDTTYYISNFDGSCESKRDTVTIKVNSLPTASINALPDHIILHDVPVKLTGSPVGGTFTGKGISNDTLNPHKAGLGINLISYLYTVGNGCKDTATTTILVCDTLITTLYDTVIINRYDTTFVTVYDTVTKYISVTDTLIIDVLITSAAPAVSNRIKAYPNPTNNILNIDLGDYAAMNGYIIRINNSLGQVVYLSAVDSQLKTIDISTLGGLGLYYLQIIDDALKIKETRKIILQ